MPSLDDISMANIARERSVDGRKGNCATGCTPGSRQLQQYGLLQFVCFSAHVELAATFC
jgi:hypothetical protein